MVFEINASDKILVIASLPEDLVVGCGGLISKYNKNIDVLCIDFENNTRDIAESKLDKYCAILLATKINKFYIESFSEDSEKHYKNIMTQFDMKNYDIILIPNKDDSSPERQFAANILLKTLLEKQGCKDTLHILRYEVWNPLKEANYYEDITNFVENKRNLVLNYKKNDGIIFADRVLNLNKFRTFTSPYCGSATHVEAYFDDDLNAYLEKPDVINKVTDNNFKNEEIERFLIESNAQNKINALAQRFLNKRVVLFGAGEFTRCVFKNYDLSRLNIIAIADKRFEQKREHEFYGLHCIKPSDIKNIGADVVLIAEMDFVKFYDILTNTILQDYDIGIAPLIKTDLNSVLKGDFGDKVCAHPFHSLYIVPTGHCITCCPAYINNFTIGNIYKNDFNTIWKGKRANYLRNALINNDYTTCDLKTCIHLELMNKSEISEYFDAETGEIKMPDSIFMSWDYDCNAACITCRNDLIKNDEHTLQELANIEQGVLEACKNAKFFYTSGNGDPFGSNYARNLIKKIVNINPNIKFLIHTNGILCNKKTCDELKITDKMQSVTFSIHAASKETYDKIVRYGNFDKVMENLSWISSLKKEGKIETIVLVFVVHKLNYKDMPDFVKIAEKYDAAASFRYYRQWAHNTTYNYDDMAVFEKSHPEHEAFVEVLQDQIFDSPHCSLDPSLRLIRTGK